MERITSKQTLLYKVTAIGILSLFVFLYFIRPMFGIGKSNAVAFRTNAIVEFCFLYTVHCSVVFSYRIDIFYKKQNRRKWNFRLYDISYDGRNVHVDIFLFAFYCTGSYMGREKMAAYNNTVYCFVCILWGAGMS